MTGNLSEAIMKPTEAGFGDDAPCSLSTSMVCAPEDHSELEIVISSASRAIAPDFPSPGNWFCDNENFGFCVTNQLKRDQGTESLPSRELELSGTPRKRRRSRGTDLERLFTDGPNPFGRTGRRKCQKCRSHRVRCEFNENSSDLPCKRCAAMGYVCSPKSLGEKSQLVAERNKLAVTSNTKRPPSVPHMPIYITPEQRLLPNDDDYLRFYDLTFRKGLKSRELMYVSAAISYVPFYNVDIDTTSRPIMAAALALASLAQCGQRTDDTKSYYTHYLEAANALKAIANNSLSNLMYASYVMAILHCLYEQSTNNVLVHCAQFCRLADLIFQGELSEKDRSWLIALWHSVVRSAYHHYWVQQNIDCFGNVDARAITVKHADLSIRIPYSAVMNDRDGQWRRKSLNKLINILQISAPFASPLTVACLDTPTRLHNKLLYLQIFLEQFLFQESLDPETSPTRHTSAAALVSNLTEIIDLIELLPQCTTLIDEWSRCYARILVATHPFDVADSGPIFKCMCLQRKLLDPLSITMIYGSARLLVKLLTSKDLDHNEGDVSEACNLALANLHLIWSTRMMASETTYPAFIRRSLFWSGIVLYKGGNHIGKHYIKQSAMFPRFLADYTDEARSCFQKNFSSCMEAAKRCRSWNAIWTIEADGLRLMDYALSYVPWFCTPQTESFWAIC